MTDPSQVTTAAPPVPQVTLEAFSNRVVASQLLTVEQLQKFMAALRERPTDGPQLARELVRAGRLTAWQAQQVYKGQTQGLVLGNYVLLDKLGQGGMGAVYKARHKRMDRLVAIKTLSPALTKTPDLVARFQREVQAAARLEHPNIVTAHDADQVGKTCFLVMQYVEGQDLATLIRDHGPLPVDKAVNCVLQAARGLEYAHRKRVVHRDIKPANLLLDKEGTVKVLDMGLARIEATEQSEAALTSTGAVMGTVDYMPPEQALDTHHADARSDIYSLGCTLHYLLTGRAPFGGDTVVKKILAHRETQIPDLTSPHGVIPETLLLVFQKMLAKDPQQRYQTMTEVLAALDLCVPRSASAPRVQTATSEDARFNTFLQKIEAEPRKSVSRHKPVPAQADPEATVTVASEFEETDARTHPPGTAAPRIGQSRQQTKPPRRNWWQDWRVLAGAGAAAVLAGVIIITISNKDGTKTTVRVPEGTPTDVQTAPGSQVTITESDDSVVPQSIGPSSDAQSLPPARSSDPIYAHDFSRPDPIWSAYSNDRVQFEIRDGTFGIRSRNGRWLHYGSIPRLPACDIEISGRAHQGMWGFMAQFDTTKKGVVVLLNTSGELQISYTEHISGGQYDWTIPAPIPSKKFRCKGGEEFNLMRAVIQNRQIHLWVNGDVACDPIEVPEGGQKLWVGFAAHQDSSGGPVDAEFDSIRIWELDAAIAPVYEHDFSDPDSFWFPEANADRQHVIRDGRFVMDATSGYWRVGRPPAVESADFEILGRSDSGAWGFWAADDWQRAAGILVGVSPTGDLQAWTTRNKAPPGESYDFEYTPITLALRPFALKPGGEFSILRAVIRDDKVNLWINDQPACDEIVLPQAVRPVHVWLAGTADETGLHAEFDSVRIWVADAGPPLPSSTQE